MDYPADEWLEPSKESIIQGKKLLFQKVSEGLVVPLQGSDAAGLTGLCPCLLEYLYDIIQC